MWNVIHRADLSQVSWVKSHQCICFLAALVMTGSPYPNSLHDFPQLLHLNTLIITLLSDSEGWPAQIEQYPVWLKHYGHVCNIDSSMWLTVRGGVYPSPIIPSSSSFETWWRFSVCACVEKAARRAECQLSAHVVNIRNQTGANRMQVRLAIAFICTNKPPWHLIISHCYIGTVCSNRPSVWRDGCGWRRLNISINCGGVRINSFDNWAPWV